MERKSYETTDVGQKEMTRDRAIQLLTRCVEWMSEYGTYETSILREALCNNCGFEKDELEEIGFSWVIPENVIDDDDDE